MATQVNTDYPFVDGHLTGTDLTIHFDPQENIQPDPGAAVGVFTPGQDGK